MKPPMDADERRLDQITDKIIGAAYAVANSLGSGFLEKVYGNALAYEVRQTGLTVEQQRGLKVHYRGVLVGEYVADMVVEDEVLVELKAVKTLDDVHMAQCLNYSRPQASKSACFSTLVRARCK